MPAAVSLVAGRASAEISSPPCPLGAARGCPALDERPLCGFQLGRRRFGAFTPVERSNGETPHGSANSGGGPIAVFRLAVAPPSRARAGRRRYQIRCSACAVGRRLFRRLRRARRGPLTNGPADFESRQVQRDEGEVRCLAFSGSFLGGCLSGPGCPAAPAAAEAGTFSSAAGPCSAALACPPLGREGPVATLSRRGDPFATTFPRDGGRQG